MTRKKAASASPRRPRTRLRAQELAFELARLDPLSDDALEIARVGLVEGVRSTRFELLQATTLAAWAGSVAAHALKETSVPRSLREELLADARLWLIEQIREFQPAENGGSCGAFVRARQDWFRSASRRNASGQTISHGRFAVLGAIGAVTREFHARDHRDPTNAELRTRVTEVLTEQARTKVLAGPSGGELDEAALAAEVRRRLSKNGVTSALEHFDQVRLEALPDLPLQLQETDDDTPHWGVPLPTVTGPDPDTRDEEASFEALLMVALGDAQWARTAFGQRAGETSSGADTESSATTLKDLAREAGHSTGELKDVLAAARCRVLAPHAQWAHLAPGL